MGSVQNLPLNEPAHPVTEDVEHPADAILDHVLVSTARKATMDEIAFPFLNLPVELQTEVVNYLSQPSDLKTLRRVSKQASDIVTPRLYYKVDLTNETDYRRIPQRINSLLIQPANLHFVRILMTPTMGHEETQLMDRLLPLLRQDSLTEFKFWTVSTEYFPTPLQMKFMWTHQKNIQNAKLYSHMVPVLDEFLKEHQPSRGALLKSFTNLDISDRCHDFILNIQSRMSWPLQNLDLSVLQKLRIDGVYVDDFILLTLDTLFADGSFVNLRSLTFVWINFERTLTLTNLPSLKFLALKECRSRGPSQPFILADGIRLSSFWASNFGRIEKTTTLLTQIKSLEFLTIKRLNRITATDQTEKDLALAIIQHKETLRLLNLEEQLALQPDELLWDIHIVKAIKSCKKLVDLSLPLVSNRPMYYYLDLIESFPDLVNLTIYDGLGSCANWSRDSVQPLFKAAKALESIVFEGFCPYRNSWGEHRFVRIKLT